jgi:ribonuclease HI
MLTPTAKVRELNDLIDAALRAPPAHAGAAAATLPANEPASLAERVRRRATQIARRDRAHTTAILTARDALIEAVYARAAPRAYVTAWCDGTSLASDDRRRAGIGGVLRDAGGARLSAWSRALPACDAFAAEIAALAAALHAALAHGATRVRAHTDCVALHRLWHAHRSDARLAEVRAAAAPLERFELRSVPRLHNQAAHRLARAAVSRAPRSR